MKNTRVEEKKQKPRDDNPIIVIAKPDKVHGEENIPIDPFPAPNSEVTFNPFAKNPRIFQPATSENPTNVFPAIPNANSEVLIPPPMIPGPPHPPLLNPVAPQPMPPPSSPSFYRNDIPFNNPIVIPVVPPRTQADMQYGVSSGASFGIPADVQPAMPVEIPPNQPYYPARLCPEYPPEFHPENQPRVDPAAGSSVPYFYDPQAHY